MRRVLLLALAGAACAAVLLLAAYVFEVGIFEPSKPTLRERCEEAVEPRGRGRYGRLLKELDVQQCIADGGP